MWAKKVRHKIGTQSILLFLSCRSMKVNATAKVKVNVNSSRMTRAFGVLDKDFMKDLVDENAFASCFSLGCCMDGFGAEGGYEKGSKIRWAELQMP